MKIHLSLINLYFVFLPLIYSARESDSDCVNVPKSTNDIENSNVCNLMATPPAIGASSADDNTRDSSQNAEILPISSIFSKISTLWLTNGFGQFVIPNKAFMICSTLDNRCLWLFENPHNHVLPLAKPWLYYQMPNADTGDTSTVNKKSMAMMFVANDEEPYVSPNFFSSVHIVSFLPDGSNLNLDKVLVVPDFRGVVVPMSKCPNFFFGSTAVVQSFLGKSKSIFSEYQKNMYNIITLFQAVQDEQGIDVRCYQQESPAPIFQCFPVFKHPFEPQIQYKEFFFKFSGYVILDEYVIAFYAGKSKSLILPLIFRFSFDYKENTYRFALLDDNCSEQHVLDYSPWNNARICMVPETSVPEAVYCLLAVENGTSTRFISLRLPLNAEKFPHSADFKFIEKKQIDVCFSETFWELHPAAYLPDSNLFIQQCYDKLNIYDIGAGKFLVLSDIQEYILDHQTFELFSDAFPPTKLPRFLAQLSKKTLEDELSSRASERASGEASGYAFTIDFSLKHFQLIIDSESYKEQIIIDSLQSLITFSTFARMSPIKSVRLMGIAAALVIHLCRKH